jgi:hypothetical protein
MRPRGTSDTSHVHAHTDTGDTNYAHTSHPDTHGAGSRTQTYATEQACTIRSCNDAEQTRQQLQIDACTGVQDNTINDGDIVMPGNRHEKS